MYNLDYDAVSRIVIADMRGFWDVPTVERFFADTFRLYEETKRKHPFFRVLARCGEMKVQSQQVGEAFSSFGPRSLEICPGPIAIVAASMLNKMQVDHFLPLPRLRVFMDETEAHAWLISIGQEDIAGIEARTPERAPSINYI